MRFRNYQYASPAKICALLDSNGYTRWRKNVSQRRRALSFDMGTSSKLSASDEKTIDSRSANDLTAEAAVQFIPKLTSIVKRGIGSRMKSLHDANILAGELVHFNGLYRSFSAIRDSRETEDWTLGVDKNVAIWHRDDALNRAEEFRRVVMTGSTYNLLRGLQNPPGDRSGSSTNALFDVLYNAALAHPDGRKSELRNPVDSEILSSVLKIGEEVAPAGVQIQGIAEVNQIFQTTRERLLVDNVDKPGTLLDASFSSLVVASPLFVEIVS